MGRLKSYTRTPVWFVPAPRLCPADVRRQAQRQQTHVACLTGPHSCVGMDPPPNRCLLHTLLGASASPVEPVYCCVPHAQVHRSPEVPCRSKVSIHAILMAAESFALALLDIVHRPEFWTQNYSGSQSDRSKYKRDLFAKSNFEKHPSPSAALILRIGTL